MISTGDYLFYLDTALDGMVEILVELGDELANRCLDAPGANSPYAVLTHCLGVMDFWAGHVVAGRRVERDRDAEFTARGTVEEIVERTRRARRQLEADIATVEPPAAPRGTPAPDVADLPPGRTQGGALIHVYEELAQHRGQMEVTRDVLMARRAEATE